MADLQDAIVLLRELDQFGGLRGVVGHRFLDEDMFAALQKQLGQLEVRDGGGDDADGVGVVGNFRDRTQRVGVMFGRDVAGDLVIGVVDADEVHQTGGGHLGVDAHMLLAERAGAENGDFHL